MPLVPHVLPPGQVCFLNYLYVIKLSIIFQRQLTRQRTHRRLISNSINNFKSSLIRIAKGLPFALGGFSRKPEKWKTHSYKLLGKERARERERERVPESEQSKRAATATRTAPQQRHMRRMRNFVSLIRKPLQAKFILKSRAIYRTCNVLLSPAVCTLSSPAGAPLAGCSYPNTRVALFARRLPKARQLFIQAASPPMLPMCT